MTAPGVEDERPEWEAIMARAERRHRLLMRVTFGVGGGVLLLSFIPLAYLLVADGEILVAVLISLTYLVAVALVGGLSVLLHRRGVRSFVAGPLLGVDRPRRRQVRRALKSGRHLTGVDERLAVDAALRLKQLPWVWTPLVILNVSGLTLGAFGEDGFEAVPFVPFCVMWVLILVLMVRESRRGRRYLTGAPPDVVAQA